MTSSAVEATVESCAAEASALGFTCTWHDRSTGAPVVVFGSRKGLTLRLTHESAEDAVNVDFLPVLDRVHDFLGLPRHAYEALSSSELNAAFTVTRFCSACRAAKLSMEQSRYVSMGQVAATAPVRVTALRGVPAASGSF